MESNQLDQINDQLEEVEKVEKQLEEIRKKVLNLKWDLRELKNKERANIRKQCNHSHVETRDMVFSDDSYSQWTEKVKECIDCGEWWR